MSGLENMEVECVVLDERQHYYIHKNSATYLKVVGSVFHKQSFALLTQKNNPWLEVTHKNSDNAIV